MTEWTSEAEKERDQFLSRQRHALSGADVNIEEVIDDIRRHFDEELKGLSVVTRADVQRTIRCFEPPPPLFPCEGPTKPTRLPDQNRPGIPLTLFGVVLPLISILVELTIHFCAGVFFDPIPSWWHVALVTLVPLGNALQIRRLRLAGEPPQASLWGSMRPPWSSQPFTQRSMYPSYYQGSSRPCTSGLVSFPLDLSSLSLRPISCASGSKPISPFPQRLS